MKFHYRNKRNSRKQQIVNWYLQEDNRTETIKSLEYFLNTGSIHRFEDVLESQQSSFFNYVVTEKMSEEFAYRLIAKLNVERTVPKHKEEREEQTFYGTVKGEKVKIVRWVKVHYKLKDGTTKIYTRGMDKNYRFVKL